MNLKPRVTRITKQFAEVTFDVGSTRQHFYLKREGSTWTLSRARGIDQSPMTWDGFKTQKDAATYAAKAIAKELA